EDVWAPPGFVWRRTSGAGVSQIARIRGVSLPAGTGQAQRTLCAMRCVVVREQSRGVPPAATRGNGLPVPSGVHARWRAIGYDRGEYERALGGNWGCKSPLRPGDARAEFAPRGVAEDVRRGISYSD